MICATYRELSIEEQRDLIGKLIILVQNSDTACNAGLAIVETGEQSGFLKRVKIFMPELEEEVLS